MKRIFYLAINFLAVFILVFNAGCKKYNETPDQSDIWDIDAEGIPKFAGVNYIELDKIYRISRYRSSVGHDYSDAYEHCRSMKHYFEPWGNIDWTGVHLYSPVTGTITRVEEEWAGTKLEIASDEYPAFRFSIFHINLSTVRSVDDKVEAGELLGNHIGPETMSDISVIVNDPTRQGRMVSYFEVMTDEVFNEFAAYGVTSRESMIISKEERDANPLTCIGDQFDAGDSVECWFYLD